MTAAQFSVAGAGDLDESLGLLQVWLEEALQSTRAMYDSNNVDVGTNDPIERQVTANRQHTRFGRDLRAQTTKLWMMAQDLAARYDLINNPVSGRGRVQRYV